MNGGNVKILVVGPPVLSRLIQRLFEGHTDFEVARSLGGLRRIGLQSEGPGPRIIVANVKPVGTNIRGAVRALKQSSPLAKVILVCSFSDLAEAARDSGADAFLTPDDLVRRLLPEVLKLSASSLPQISSSTVS